MGIYEKAKSDMHDYQLLEHGPQEEHSTNFHIHRKKINIESFRY